MQTLVDILTAARDLIAEPEHWTQGVSARNKFSEKIHPAHPTAVCWCTLGALQKVGNPAFHYEAQDILFESALKLHPQWRGRFLYGFNDSHSHSEILQVFDEAIRYANHA